MAVQWAEATWTCDFCGKIEKTARISEHPPGNWRSFHGGIYGQGISRKQHEQYRPILKFHMCGPVCWNDFKQWHKSALFAASKAYKKSIKRYQDGRK